MDKYLDFVSIPPDVWTMIFTWCNLLILFLLVRKLLFKPVQNILKKREQEVGEMYSDAESAQAEAEALKAEYADKLASAKDEAVRIVKAADEEAQRRGGEIVRDAEDKAAAAYARAEKRIESERKAAEEEVRSQMAELAVTIAGKVIEKELDGETREKLIDEFIDNEVRL